MSSNPPAAGAGEDPPGVDRLLALSFLLTSILMPFTSDLPGTFSANPLAVDIFGLNLLLASLATQATLMSKTAIMAIDCRRPRSWRGPGGWVPIVSSHGLHARSAAAPGPLPRILTWE